MWPSIVAKSRSLSVNFLLQSAQISPLPRSQSKKLTGFSVLPCSFQILTDQILCSCLRYWRINTYCSSDRTGHRCWWGRSRAGSPARTAWFSVNRIQSHRPGLHVVLPEKRASTIAIVFESAIENGRTAFVSNQGGGRWESLRMLPRPFPRCSRDLLDAGSSIVVLNPLSDQTRRSSSAEKIACVRFWRNALSL
jgi:hypothetical protein